MFMALTRDAIYAFMSCGRWSLEAGFYEEMSAGSVDLGFFDFSEHHDIEKGVCN